MSDYNGRPLDPTLANSQNRTLINTFLKPSFESHPVRWIGIAYFPLPLDSYFLGLIFILMSNYLYRPEMWRLPRDWNVRFLLRRVVDVAFVFWMGAVATGVTVNTWAWGIKSFIQNYGNYFVFYLSKYFVGFYILTIMTQLPCHIYLAYRLWLKLEKMPFISIAVIGASMVAVVGTVFQIANSINNYTMLASISKSGWATGTRLWCAGTLGADLLICIFTLLAHQRSGNFAAKEWKEGGGWFWKGVYMVADCQMISAALALTNFIIFFAGGSFDLMMPTYILLTKCYPLSILYVLICENPGAAEGEDGATSRSYSQDDKQYISGSTGRPLPYARVRRSTFPFKSSFQLSTLSKTGQTKSATQSHEYIEDGQHEQDDPYLSELENVKTKSSSVASLVPGKERNASRGA